MKFATVISEGHPCPVVILTENCVLSLGKIFRGFCDVDVLTLNEFIRYSADVDMQAFSEYCEKWAAAHPEDCMAAYTLDAPIPYPARNLICLGKNYSEHAAEILDHQISSADVPQYPIYFSKIASPAVGPGEEIPLHTGLTEAIDYEVELAVVIGKSGKDIAVDQVEDHIFGYTIANDLSARDLQGRHQQWFKGKSLDGFAPMGPWIVHKSDLPLPLDLGIELELNGQLVQKSRTSMMVFDIPTLISDLSRGMSLKAGDIILTGTPAGTGMGFNPPRYLSGGDVMKCSIEGIGTLINRMQE